MKQGNLWGRVPVYPSIHFLTRQANREKLAASRALTETARQRHLELADLYLQRASKAQLRRQA
jgi:hypothetical protein